MISNPDSRHQHIESLMVAGQESEALASLDAALKELHGSGDAVQLCGLHMLAADLLGRQTSDANQPMFHLTHALVYALEAGSWPLVKTLESRLWAAGRL